MAATARATIATPAAAHTSTTGTAIAATSAITAVTTRKYKVLSHIYFSVINSIKFIIAQNDMSVEAFKTKENKPKPSRKQAEEAVETLLRYIGENPDREGLRETPARYVRAFDEFFAGYDQDPAEELVKTFEDIEDYDDFVLVKGIDFVSHCEHHIVPIIGKAHVAYWPDKKVVGISKLARVVDVMSKRLTSQENMTRQVAEIIETTLDAKGVAVMIDANHQCMSTRGVEKTNSSTVTFCFKGLFKNPEDQHRFLEMIK